VSPVSSEMMKPVVDFCFPSGLAAPPPPQPPNPTSHFSDEQELQFNPGPLPLPQPHGPVCNPSQLADPLHCLTQAPQQAFLTPSSLLQLGQPSLFGTPLFSPAQQHSLFPMPHQLMWPAPMSLYPTGYPPPGHAVLPSHILAADPLTTFQQLQNTSYLTRVGLKRPLVNDLDLESKRLRLAAMPF